MPVFPSNFNPSTSPEGFDEFGIPKRWSSMPAEWRSAYAQKYAAITSPSQYFDVMMSIPNTTGKDLKALTPSTVYDNIDLLNSQHLIIFNPALNDGDEDVDIQSFDEWLNNRAHVNEDISVSKYGMSMVVGRFMPTKGRVYSSTDQPSYPAVEILSGQALNTLKSNKEATNNILKRFADDSDIDWLRIALGNVPPKAVNVPSKAVNPPKAVNVPPVVNQPATAFVTTEHNTPAPTNAPLTVGSVLLESAKRLEKSELPVFISKVAPFVMALGHSPSVSDLSQFRDQVIGAAESTAKMDNISLSMRYASAGASGKAALQTFATEMDLNDAMKAYAAKPSTTSTNNAVIRPATEPQTVPGAVIVPSQITQTQTAIPEQLPITDYYGSQLPTSQPPSNANLTRVSTTNETSAKTDNTYLIIGGGLILALLFLGKK